MMMRLDEPRVAWPKIFLATLTLCLTSTAFAAEVIGPYLVEAPISANLVAGATNDPRWVDGSGWLNVVNVPVSINDAFAGPGIIDRGYANGIAGTTVQMNFAAPIVNGPGDEFVLFDARFSESGYLFSIDTNGFAAPLQVMPQTFSALGLQNLYYYGANPSGPFPADVFARGIDLSSFGVPIGGSATAVRVAAFTDEVDLLGVGAIVVPEPSTTAIILLLAGTCRRRRRQ